MKESCLKHRGTGSAYQLPYDAHHNNNYQHSRPKRARLNPSEAIPDPELHRLLDIDDNKDILDEESIIKVVLDKPFAARAKYSRSMSKYAHAQYPLYIAIEQRASFEVVDILYKACPAAVRAKSTDRDTPLHLACEQGAPPEVISLLLMEWPEATMERDVFGRTPLHCTCANFASAEVVSLLLEAYPEAARMKNTNGKTPLHFECEKGSSRDVILLLLEAFPEGAKEVDHEGRTPLHCLCTKREEMDEKTSVRVKNGLSTGESKSMDELTDSISKFIPSPEVVALLLERYPEAVQEEDDQGETPIDYWNEHHSPEYDEEIATIVYGIETLYRTDLSQSIAIRIMEEFNIIGWWAGIALAFDIHPALMQSLDDLPINVIPSILSVLGRRCRKLTMWNMVLNRQDVLNTT